MVLNWVSIVGSTVLELLSSVIITKGLIEEGAKISRWSTVFIFVATVYIVLAPNEWTSGSYILLFLYIYLGYHITVKDSLIDTILCLILVGCVEIICLFPIVFLLHGMCSDMVNNLLGACFSMLVCAILVWKVPIWRLKKWCDRKEAFYVAIVVFSLALMIKSIIKYHMTLELELGDYLYIMVGILLLWAMAMELMKYKYKEELRKKYFVAFQNVMDQMKRRQHKFQNQLDAIYSLHHIYDDYETLVREQRNYLGKLVDYEMPADILILENPIVIAHVYEKITEAQEAGIHVHMKLSCSMEKCGIEDIHIVEMLGTLLDNAIQDMLETDQKDYLYFEIKEEKGIVICVGNPHSRLLIDEMKKMFEKGYTTKAEGQGIGLYHVKKLTQKYGMDQLVENRIIDGKNYICFSLLIKTQGT